MMTLTKHVTGVRTHTFFLVHAGSHRLWPAAAHRKALCGSDLVTNGTSGTTLGPCLGG